MGGGPGAHSEPPVILGSVRPAVGGVRAALTDHLNAAAAGELQLKLPKAAAKRGAMAASPDLPDLEALMIELVQFEQRERELSGLRGRTKTPRRRLKIGQSHSEPDAGGSADKAEEERREREGRRAPQLWKVAAEK